MANILCTTHFPNTTRLVSVDDADAARLAPYAWYINAQGFAVARIQGKVVRMHRFILSLPPRYPGVDFHDGNRLNLHRSNLRVRT